MKRILKSILLLLFAVFCVQTIFPQKQLEKLGRGIIALNAGSNKIYVGWRFLGSDPSDLAFNLYKAEGTGSFIKVNTKPMSIKTDTVLSGCNLLLSNSFYVKTVRNGIESETSKIFTLAANTAVRQYVNSIPLQIMNESMPTSNAMPGDLNGDGEYELVVMRTGAGGDTARMVLESYKLDGTYMWRFEFGKNINQSNEHNAQAYYVVYDFDGDGKSEVCVRGSERSVFQAGSPNERMVGDVLIKDGITLYPITASLQRPSAPEYLFMLDGATGKALDSIKYEPAMGPASDYNTTWGGNERPYYQWMSVGYLDGKYPSIVTQRGIGEGYSFKIYGFDYRNGKFTMRPDSFVTQEPIAFGGHSIRIKDIDNDGKDEVLFTGAAVDHNMKLMYNQETKGIGHGDGYQILDIDPDRPGLEWFAIQQNTGGLVGAYYWDAATGDVLKKYYMNTPSDPSRGDAAPICANIRGAQMYGGTQGVMAADGSYVNKLSFIPCGTVYWDADLAKELIENANSYRTLTLKKYDQATGNANIIFNFNADGAGNNTMAGATYYGDLVGDWREEVVAEATENSKLVLRIYTTTTPSNNRYYTLMHNPSYRTQLTSLGRIGGFYPDFYFGPGMTVMPPSPIADEDIRWSGNQSIWDNTKTKSWVNATGEQGFAAGNKVLFDDYGIVTNKTVQITENIAPSVIKISSSDDYTFTGTGNITGTTELIKNGKGTLTLSNNNTFTGKTTVWDGALTVNGSFNSPLTVYGGVYGGVMANGLTGGRISGSGTFLQPVILADKGAIIPGKAINDIDTFRIMNNLVMRKSSYIAFDLGASPSTKSDIVKVAGNFTLEDSVYFAISAINTPTSGTYSLVEYAGSFVGSIAKIKVLGLENQTFSLTDTGHAIHLIIQPARKPSTIVWGGVANTWEKTTDKNWYLNSVLETFVPNDSVIINNQGISKPDIKLTGNLPVNSLLVNSSGNYTLFGNGNISGTGGLTKQGTGKLTILNNNNFTGQVKLQGGTIELKTNVYANDASPLGRATESPVNMEMSNSQLRFSAPIAMGQERGMTISGNDTIYALNTVSFSGIITGTGKLIKTGAGKINFTKQNTFTGGTLLKEGIVTFADNNNPLGNGLITFGGGRLTMYDNSGNTETFSTPLDIPAGITATIDLDSRMVFSSNLTGSGILNLFSPFVRSDLKGNWSAFMGTINVTTDTDGGDFRITNSYGYGNSLVTLGAGVSAYLNGSYTVAYGALASTATDAKVTTPFTVGTKNTNTSFSGLILGTGAVTKSGTGSWTLSNANTYTGVTNIEGGSLYVVNTTGSATGTGNISVKSTGTLGGTGIMSGSVTVMANGTLAPGGASSIGTLSIGTSLVFNNSGVMTVRVNADTNTSDVVNVTGTTSLTGVILNITKSSGTYNAGDRFKIIKCSNITGTVSQIIPDKPGTNLAWDITELNTTGTVKVIDSPSALPANLTTALQVYPNPFKNQLILNVPDLTDYNLRITNISGQVVYLAKNITSSSVLVNSSNFNNGMYLVEVMSNGKTAFYKVIKL